MGHCNRTPRSRNSTAQGGQTTLAKTREEKLQEERAEGRKREYKKAK